MKKLFIFAAVAAAIGLSAGEPAMKVTEKKIDRKGVQLTRKSWKVNFHHSTLTFTNTLSPEGKLLNSAWDDLFLGVGHGNVNNGSWDGWFFLCAQGIKSKQLPNAAPASKVDFVRYNDSSAVNIKWETGDFRVLQPANTPEWLYVKVSIPEGIKTVSLRVRPGGAHYNIKGRERWIRYNGSDFESKGYTPIPLTYGKGVDGMAFYSKNYNEKFGNYLVFESDKVEKITCNGENPIVVTFHAKPGVKEMHFALSYFKNEDPENAMKRFLVEQLPTAKKVLDGIQWDKAPDFTEFSRNAAQVKNLISSMQGPKKAEFEKEFNEIQAAYEAAKSKNDVSGYASALERLRALQKKVGASAMDLLN